MDGRGVVEINETMNERREVILFRCNLVVRRASVAASSSPAPSRRRRGVIVAAAIKSY